MGRANCVKCRGQYPEFLLHRTEPADAPNSNLMCRSCLEKHEPELYRNVLQDIAEKQEEIRRSINKDLKQQKGF